MSALPSIPELELSFASRLDLCVTVRVRMVLWDRQDPVSPVLPGLCQLTF